MSAVYRNLGEGANPAKPPRLLDRMRQVLRTKHYPRLAGSCGDAIMGRCGFAVADGADFLV